MIYLGSDHAGFKLKEKVKKYLTKEKVKFQDLGTYTEDSVDASDYALKVARKVKAEKNSKGILICGSGIMMSIAANKVKGIRAALAWTPTIAQQARQHNNAQILCLAGRESVAKNWPTIIKAFLKTKPLKQAKYLRRIKKLDRIKS